MKKPTNYRAERTGGVSPVDSAIIEGVRALLVSGKMERERVEKVVAYIERRAEIVDLDDYERAIHPEPIEELQLVTRPQLAKLLKCGLRTIDYYRGKGWLKPVFVPGSSRARGYTAESVRSLLRGEYAKEANA